VHVVSVEEAAHDGAAVPPSLAGGGVAGPHCRAGLQEPPMQQLEAHSELLVQSSKQA
jgi:hypothetical protein